MGLRGFVVLDNLTAVPMVAICSLVMFAAAGTDCGEMTVPAFPGSSTHTSPTCKKRSRYVSSSSLGVQGRFFPTNLLRYATNGRVYVA